MIFLSDALSRIGLIGKLVICPMIFLPLAILFDLKEANLVILLAIFA